MVRFDQLIQELRIIRHRLDDIESKFSKWQPSPVHIQGSKLFLLPDNLRRSYMTVVSKGECNATEVSNLTGRSRAIESAYLNQLVRMGWLAKRRDSRTLSFRASASQNAKREQALMEIPCQTGRS